ncbi:MAG: glycine--tRNA ligase [Candidatus Brennerbacteria bacterium RIFOXYC1_FULL_41_11]|uniref:Glycine--tRNA ligase n=1 Tax=Candidatus Brennerbacteria bacterium RIFOXYD1_FULL_41_16 TaxID=1797529 RepID=A0A1G1XLL3_9BACT|nr:MAG: glycine--tRNA ligase [Candidatus Brennerbacteria bacterium RIFOXYB1_FULL_41_13]OGY40041.1 MAG: glycine--tRNA ligase [Candidatus Brennerbacteria bacterium RIFOXYC1_FULL_41_11]OGY40973.1 MAG: glycine--tRNA ligase [Candidatus Brennerbacteria bacterium RIFOXYD1_FULL_41_16]
MSEMKNNLMEKIVSLCKRRGFVFPNSEIYGGMNALYDYGPLGALLRKNIFDLWWRKMVTEREDVFGIDGRIILHPKVWEASGHVSGFADALVEDKKTHKRYAADKLIEEQLNLSVKSNDIEAISGLIKGGKLKSPEGNELTMPKNFNLLVPAYLGTVEGEKTQVYLKGESCQNIYVNFKQVFESMHKPLPFGIAQVGRAFRNEITSSGQFLFRQKEFDQMDVQYFCRPEDSSRFYEDWKTIRWNWYLNDLGLSEKRLKWRQHADEERAFYAKDAWDITYDFEGMGFKELEGLHDRGDYDLSQHQKFSGEDLSYFDPETKRKFIPFVVESSAGFDRNFLAILFEAYREDGERVYLKLKPYLAPYQAAVFPLLANKPQLVEKAREVYEVLKKQSGLNIVWDERGNIGKRYYSQDEIGTPFCVTIDFETLENNTVTVRDRDTAKQERVGLGDLKLYLIDKIIL